MNRQERRARDRVLDRMGLKHEARTVLLVAFVWTEKGKQAIAERCKDVGSNGGKHGSIAIVEAPNLSSLLRFAGSSPRWGVSLMVNTDESVEAVQARLDKLPAEGEQWVTTDARLLTTDQAADLWLHAAQTISKGG